MAAAANGPFLVEDLEFELELGSGRDSELAVESPFQPLVPALSIRCSITA
jgi:hypothetical protein